MEEERALQKTQLDLRWGREVTSQGMWAVSGSQKSNEINTSASRKAHCPPTF